MKRIAIVLIFSVFVSFISFAQTDSTKVRVNKERFSLSKQVVPLSLITTGALLNIGEIKYVIQDHIPNTNNDYDDYLQYVPMTQIYLFDAFGFEHQNTVFDQTKYLLISQAISAGTVHLLKHITHVERPTGADFSFPSGHTTNAFVGATVLYNEFKDTEPLLAWSGYLFATATGALRLTNNAHWLPDVLAGAGIGILSANLVYYFKPLQNFQPFKKKKDLSITTVIAPGTLAIQCRF